MASWSFAWCASCSWTVVRNSPYCVFRAAMAAWRASFSAEMSCCSASICFWPASISSDFRRIVESYLVLSDTRRSICASPSCFSSMQVSLIWASMTFSFSMSLLISSIIATRPPRPLERSFFMAPTSREGSCWTRRSAPLLASRSIAFWTTRLASLAGAAALGGSLPGSTLALGSATFFAPLGSRAFAAAFACASATLGWRGCDGAQAW
mmetsp:Transcript_58855/g.172733  ORF Transcript_58855/g.172733 Transcript_58855/m.172733 type:complete len:209 (-) Transcript_58855:1213-1839(-)